MTVRSCAASLLLLSLALGCSGPRESALRIDRFWEMAEAELRSATSEEERAIALARWVVTHSTNDHQRKSTVGTPFYGMCRHRVTVFELLARRAGLETAPVFMADFNGSGHTAVEVFYDGDWHYFDVTYAGYFRVDGRVLSLEQMRADPDRAVAGMVVLKGSLDRSGDGSNVDNAERMRANYTPEAIARLRVLPQV